MSLAVAVHAVDFYLDEEQEKERHHILELLQLDDAKALKYYSVMHGKPFVSYRS